MTTKEQDDVLRRMYPDPAVSIDEVVAVTKMTPGYIRVRAWRLGLKRPSPRERRAPRKPRVKEADMATRLAVLLGETARPPTPRRDIPDEDLLRYAGERTPPEAAAGLWDWINPYVL